MDRGLTTIKIVVVVLGLLIVAATVVLVMAAIDQVGKPAETGDNAPAAVTDGTAASPVSYADVAVALPAGSRVVSLAGTNDVLSLLVVAQDGSQSIVTLDRRSGEVLGTLELLPRIAGGN